MKTKIIPALVEQSALVALLLAFNALLPAAVAQGTAFTYQGRLNDGANLASGTYDLTFTLFATNTGGVAAAGPVTNSPTAISNGLFIVTLDFGSGAFPGADRWLEIGVRTNGGGAFSTLTARQQITSTPYAIQAANATVATSVSGSVSAAQLTGTISSNNIAAGSISTVMLAAGAVGSNQLASRAVTTAALADSAVTADKVASVSTIAALTTLNNPTPAAQDNFAKSVAVVNGEHALIGATWDDTGAVNAGAAYLFNFNGALLTTFTNPNPTVQAEFGYSVAGVGADRVLIGAPAAPTNGVVYLFNTNGALIRTFTNPSPVASFGTAVAALGNDRVLITTPGNLLLQNCSSYLFSTNGALLATFLNPGIPSDFFGYSIAPVGTGLVSIGAPQVDLDMATASPKTNSGAVYLFNTNGTLLLTLTHPNRTAQAFFGVSLAAVGNDRVLIGTPANEAFLFSTNGTLLTTFTNPEPSYSYFGSSVAALGSDRVLIGTPRSDAGAPSAGAAYVFSATGKLLATITNPAPAASDYFGTVVAGAGPDRVLIGSYADDAGATDAGTAYLLNVDVYSPGLTAEAVRAGSVTTANLQDGAVTSAKLDSTIGIWTRAGNDVYRSTGNVGVGTATPSAKLHVIGDILASGSVSGNGSGLTALNATNVSAGTLADARLSSNVAMRNANQTFTGTNTFSSQAMFNGNVGVGTTTPAVKLHVTGGTDAEPGSGGYIVTGATNTLNVAIDDNEIMARSNGVASTLCLNVGGGNVGIGRTAPGAPLDVDDRIRVTGPGGNGNTVALDLATYAPGTNSPAAQIRATDNGNYSTTIEFLTKTSGASANALVSRMHITPDGNVGIGTNGPTNKLHVVGGVSATAFVNTSDRNAKENFTPVNPRNVLEKVTALPISTWNFKTMNDGRHMGPMAQDFHAAFGLGGSDATITSVDPDGVALAAIQGLNQRLSEELKRRDVENAGLKARLEKLEKLLEIQAVPDANPNGDPL